MGFSHNTTPVDGLGPLTLGDLAMRSDRAHADHHATFTATEVLHQVFMSNPDHDQEFYHTIEAARQLIREYRAKTYREWRIAYRVWAAAAGFDIPPDETGENAEVADSGDEGEVW